MNKQDLKEQMQDNLLTYFEGSLRVETLDEMCRVIIRTIDEHER